MPRVFLEHWGGRRTFSCEKCGTYLSNRQEVVSTRFSGKRNWFQFNFGDNRYLLLTFVRFVLGCTGRAFLFRRVANIRYGEPVARKLTTGNHLLRDVFCIVCNTKLGWLYEFTHENAERYKEGWCTVSLEFNQWCRLSH
ncbi:yippee putative zinc-binding protein [Ancylostoma duodenale]|uniref:Protein yippee-like n=1 Tax=Ancylostoma duodenale TaxID=51022 RepID=A0A0C2BYT8_9BILA|nr:yippee putative zinc-binding protein [Ancylostoma duodenale]